ncbi:MAG: hypothetical protein V5A37_05990 [Halobacteriales archaeon]
MATNDAVSNGTDFDRTALYLPAMPSESLVAFVRRVREALVASE